MKKWFSGFIAGLFVASTTVAGAAVYNQLTVTDLSDVHFVFNGTTKPLPEGYKVLELNGRTYVPSRFIAESMGGTVEWNGVSKSVIITKDDALKKAQYHSMLANHYKRMETVGDKLIGLYDGFDIVKRTLEKGDASAFDTFNVRFNDVITSYNEVQKDTNNMYVLARSLGYEGTDIDAMTKNYLNAINDYKSAYKELSLFYQSGDTAHKVAYEENLNKALTLCKETQKISSNGYTIHYDKIQT